MYVCAAIPLWNSLHQFSALGNHSLTTHLHTGWWAPLRTRSHDHASHMTLFVRSLGLDAIKVCVCVLIDWYSSLHYKSFFNKSVALQLICICKFRFLMQICFFRYWVLLFPPFHFHTLYLFTVIFTFFHHMDSTKKKREVFPQHNVCHHHFHPPPSVQTHLLTCWCKHISQVVVCHTKDETLHFVSCLIRWTFCKVYCKHMSYYVFDVTNFQYKQSSTVFFFMKII